MTFIEHDFQSLIAHALSSVDEAALYLLARVVKTPYEIRLLVSCVIPVPRAEILSQSPTHMSIISSSYIRAIKKSLLDDCAFVFVHSHPVGPADFSSQDDVEENCLFNLAHRRNPQLAHASLLIAEGTTKAIARVWLEDGTHLPVDLVRVVGERWRYFFSSQVERQIPEFFDRQVRAFGSEIQNLLSCIHVGIVGAGGTGSAVAEQIVRLGVGRITVIDDDRFDGSNVNRVYDSSTYDQGTWKAQITARMAAHTGIGTDLVPITKHLSFKSVAQQLRTCDIVFGCTDDQWGRSILTRLAIYYLIPVLDLGVKIDSLEGQVRSIHGRITLLQPGYACLFCRGRISADRVTYEVIAATDPERASSLVAEGYIAGMDAPAPAVISFTSTIASAAVAEFLDRLIGYKTSDTKPSEYIYRFEADTISRNTRPPLPGCFCIDKILWGAGDRKPFLGITWRPEE